MTGIPHDANCQSVRNSAANNAGTTLQLEQTIAAPPESVFHAWIDPDAIREWFRYRVGAHWDPAPVVDARPGGGFLFSVIREQDQAAFRFRGKYREVKPGRKLVFTWEWDTLPILGVNGPGNTVVTVEFLDFEKGTKVVLTHTNLPSEAARDAHRQGWNRCLDGIASLLRASQHQADPKQAFIRVRAPLVVLEHVRVIDGTGAPARQDQTIVIERDRIAALGPSGSVAVPANAEHIDLTGYTALPGLVGMHDHLFFSSNFLHTDDVLAHDMPFSYPRLYLANGVTTIRTTGSFEPYTDLEIKKAVDAGVLIGPKMRVSGPYLEGEPFPLIQIHKLTGPDDARRMVAYWAEQGATSFKLYTDVTREEAKAAIEEAHRRGLTITGHLCSIGFTEAAELGMDNVEHGLWVDTEFASGKQPDVCPSQSKGTAADMDMDGPAIQSLIKTLVDRHVAITSTLAAWEQFVPSRPGASARVLDCLSENDRRLYESGRLIDRKKMTEGSQGDRERLRRLERMLRKEMEFERAFVRAGGLLLAGSDAVFEGDIAGFGDQREVELLVEAGFTAEEAVQIASLNGAIFLKEDEHIGSLAPGKQADIMIVKGDPSKNIQDIENVEFVFKDGIGYDSKKLIESVKGQVGIH